MSQDDLVPLKQVIGALGVSRATLWRASKSARDFPIPTIIRKRVFWRNCDIPRLKSALVSFRGRYAFERERRFELLRQAKAEVSRPRGRVGRRADAAPQPDLFGWSDEV